jgi:hypothetical protein
MRRIRCGVRDRRQGVVRRAVDDLVSAGHDVRRAPGRRVEALQHGGARDADLREKPAAVRFEQRAAAGARFALIGQHEVAERDRVLRDDHVLAATVEARDAGQARRIGV